ncbi:MAG: asparaginase domain-containing protein [Bacteroidota bacterium]
MAIHILVTGGTFDKEYNEINGELYFKDTHLAELLRLGRCRVPVSVTRLMLKDSLEMTEPDRELIVAACVQSDSRQVIVSHGTDTMTVTAGKIAARVKDKTVVLTGAMIPIAFGSSDGLFNLGCAISYVQALPPGVYIAMNGFYFPWNNVRKNKEKGFFEPLQSAE